MHVRIRSLLAGLALFAGAALARAQDLYGINNTTGELFRISTADASAVSVGPTGVSGVTGLLLHTDGFLYGFTSGSSPALVRIDPQTAATSVVGPLGVGFVFEGAIVRGPGGLVLGANAGSAASAALVQVDLGTGAATLGPVLTPGSHDLNGLALRGDGVLVGIDRVSNALIAVDTMTGATSLIQVLTPTLGACGDLAVQGGTGYFATAGFATSLPGTNELWTIDLVTGAHARVGDLGAAGSGLGFSGLCGTGLGAGTPLCFGDGSGAACPCGNASAPADEAGCLHSLGLGAQLRAQGQPSVASDGLVLVGSAMPNSTCLYFQGTMDLAGGAGLAFGDGLRCAGGTIVRLGTSANAGGASLYPEPGDPSVSVRGLVAAGDVRTYQVWYRNAAPFCTPSTFNLSNGLRVSWSP